MNQVTKNNILAELMKECGIDDIKLSQYTNVPISSISRIRLAKNCNPTISTLQPLADFFDVSIEQFLNYQPLDDDRIPGTHKPTLFTSSMLPVIKWSDVIDFIDNKETFFSNKKIEWVASEQETSENSFAVEIPDASFALFLKKGSTILIDSEKTIKNGDFVLFKVKNKNLIVLKQVLIEKDNVYIKSMNSKTNTTRTIPESYITLGNVIEIRCNLQSAPKQNNPRTNAINILNPLKI